MLLDCDTTVKGNNTADYQLLHLADYGIMPLGQGAHEGRKAQGLMGVREGTDAMVTRPQHILHRSYENDLCHSGCQLCITF